MAEVNKEYLRQKARAAIEPDDLNNVLVFEHECTPGVVLSLLDENAAQAARIAELEREASQLLKNECAHSDRVIAQLRAELEACRKDVMRYRWLRDQHNDIEGNRWFAAYQEGIGWASLDKVVLGDDREVDFDLDSAIDAAMQEGGVNG